MATISIPWKKYTGIFLVSRLPIKDVLGKNQWWPPMSTIINNFNSDRRRKRKKKKK